MRVQGDSVTLLLALVPGGLEQFFVPKSDEETDPATFGLELHSPPPA